MRKFVIKKPLLLLLAAFLFLAGFGGFSTTFADMDRVVDDAGLLSSSEEQQLASYLDSISTSRGSDVVVVTLDGTGKSSIEAAADDYFDYNDYGQGSDRSGILLLLDMDEREWAMSTRGFCIKAFTDAGQEYVANQFLPYLSDGDYYAGFMKFAELADKFLAQAATGDPYDRGSLPNGGYDYSDKAYDFETGTSEREFPVLWCLVVAVIGIVIAGIMTLAEKSKLTSVAPQRSAEGYSVGGLRVTESRDFFLYKTVHRTRHESSRSGGGGGSSTHHSSSGATHGGSHGHF